MEPRTKFNRWLGVGSLLVGFVTLVTHWRSWLGKFVDWDDPTIVTQHVAIRSLNWEHLRVIFTETVGKLYVPLTSLSFALDYQIWGRHPFGYHLTNLILHVANTLLVLAIIHHILAGRHPRAVGVALVTAALFGIHPLHVESVAWVTERKDVLFALFYLLALRAYLAWTTDHTRAAYWACFGCFIAATLAKSTAVTLPVVLWLIDYFWARRTAWREKIPFFAVSILIAAITCVAQAGGLGQTLPGTAVIPIWARVGLVGYCGLFYVQKFFWPFHLTAIYPPFDELGWEPQTGLIFALALVGVTGLLFWLRHRWPLVWPGWLFYLVTLAPTIGLLPAGIHIVADRFAYLPLLGLAIPVAAGLVWLGARQWWVWLGVAGWLIGLTSLSWQRTADWHDTETLFKAALRENPRCLPAHINLTVWYTSHEQLEMAIAHGQQAVEIAPAGLPGRKNLAVALMHAARYREAIAVLQPAVEHGVADPHVWRQLVKCFESVGELQNAQAARAQLDRLTPDSQ